MSVTLVRQAISFTYQGRATGSRTELGAALANVLLRDYAAALGIQEYESGTNSEDWDFGRASGYAMEWQVPDTEFDRLNTIGDDGNTAFKYTPAIGKYRPVLRGEALRDREIAVRLEDLACPRCNCGRPATGILESRYVCRDCVESMGYDLTSLDMTVAKLFAGR